MGQPDVEVTAAPVLTVHLLMSRVNVGHLIHFIKKMKSLMPTCYNVVFRLNSSFNEHISLLTFALTDQLTDSSADRRQ